MTRKAKRLWFFLFLSAAAVVMIARQPTYSTRWHRPSVPYHIPQPDFSRSRVQRSAHEVTRQTWWQRALCNFRNSTLHSNPSNLFHLPRLYSDITPKTTDYNIFLSDTACNARPYYRAWCSAESWAGQNPGAEVWYILTSPAADDSDGLVQELKHHYENLHVVGADLDKMFSQTPLDKFFKSGNWTRNTPWPQSNLSNLLRNIVVWLWGGFYSDADTICIKNITHLHNIIAYQYYSDSFANNALMQFEAGHQFVYMVMEYLKDNFKLATWHVNGPGAATKVLKELCNVTDLDDVLNGTRKCEGVSLLPENMLQPIPHQMWQFYFTKGYGYKFEEKLKSVYVLHTWNKLSEYEPIIIGRDSIYDVAARTYCPITYSHAAFRSAFF